MACDPKKENEPSMWLVEYMTRHDAYHHGVKEMLYDSHSQFQHIQIADVGAYGRALFLDSALQTTEGDESFYHEPMVHFPCLIQGKPKSILILGGADGGSAREALRWTSVESVKVVDIDGQVVEACRKHMSNIARGSLDNPKCEVIVANAIDFVRHCREIFDVIICDLTDPVEDGPSNALFTKEFFSKLKEILSPYGAISVMGGTTSLPENSRIFPRTCATLKAVFSSVRPGQMFVPKYGSPLGVIVATDQSKPLPHASKLDEILANRVKGELHVIDGQSVHGHFAIPRCLRIAVESEKRVFTSDPSKCADVSNLHKKN